MLNIILGLFGTVANAAADPAVISATNTFATSVKDTAVGSITDFLPVLGILFALGIAVTLVVRWTRRMAK